MLSQVIVQYEQLSLYKRVIRVFMTTALSEIARA